MERVIGLVVNDAALLAPFVARNAEALDVSDLGRRGFWGLGFLGNGELLVKRAPLGTGSGLGAALSGVRTRHVVVAADGAPAPRRMLEDAQPLRYRDWLFAASGVGGLGARFVEGAQAATRMTSFGQKRGVTPDEALMLVFMDALYRGHARDTRKLPAELLRDGVREAARAVDALTGDAPTDLAVLLYGHDQLYAVALGRPLFWASFTGDAWAREARSTETRRQMHLRGAIVTDRPTDGAGIAWKQLDDAAISVGTDGVPVPFALA